MYVSNWSCFPSFFCSFSSIYFIQSFLILRLLLLDLFSRPKVVMYLCFYGENWFRLTVSTLGYRQARLASHAVTRLFSLLISCLADASTDGVQNMYNFPKYFITVFSKNELFDIKIYKILFEKQTIINFGDAFLVLISDKLPHRDKKDKVDVFVVLTEKVTIRIPQLTTNMVHFMKKFKLTIYP